MRIRHEFANITKNLLIMLSMLIFWSLSAVHADKTWEKVWQSPPSIYEPSFIDNMNGWMVTSDNLLHTKDAGKTFEFLPMPPAWKISFVDKENGWCFSEEGIYRTKDGGKTWKLQKDGRFHRAWFLDDQKGWVVGPKGLILHTRDGGETWQQQESQVTGDLYYVRFSDERHGWIYGMANPPPSDDVILYTTDGGETWEIIERSNGLLLIYALDEKHVWIERNRTFYFSEDAGKHWQKLSEGIHAKSTTSAQFANANVGWILQGNYLLKTEDGGRNWRRIDFPPRMYADHYIQFLSEKEGWIAGNGLIHTADGGVTFEVQSPPWTNLMTIFFLNEEIGWAAGESLLQTKDGGASWEYLNEKVERGLIFNDLYFIDEHQGWGTYESVSGAIVQTENGGWTWRKQWENRWQSLRYGKLFFINPQEGWAAGVNLILHTKDGGKRWEPIAQIDDFRLSDIYFFDEKHGCVIGRLGIYSTKNGGKEWTRVLPGRWNDNTLYFTTRNEGWALVDLSLYRTKNGGKDWEKVESPSFPSFPPEIPYNLIFIDANEGWVSAWDTKTQKGKLYQTTDGGKTWKWKESLARVSSFDTFCYDGAKSIYLALGEGTILKYTDASYAERGRRLKGGLAVEALGKKVVQWGDVKRTLLRQNYPNPFNPETYIPYILAEPGEVTIKIFDVQGRLLRMLPLGVQPAGAYLDKSRATYWDGRNAQGEPMASGVYFYQLVTPMSQQTRRMVILK